MPETNRKAFQLVAQLQISDLPAAAWTLTDRFGFKAEAGYLDVRQLPSDTETLRLRRLDQVIELARAKPGVTLGHGAFDHLALRSRDVDSAVMALRAKWARLDPDVTPDGPMDLPMFWSKGVRIVFALGPQEARIELCQHIGAEDAAQMVNLGGHDHFGVRCRDVAEATDFYSQFGFVPKADLSIETPEGPIEIRFVKRGAYLLEIASTPVTRASGATFAEHPLWSKVILETDDAGGSVTCRTGPNGEVVELRPSVARAPFHFDGEDLQ
ncbi:MAG: VOC family protein [Marivita sp.]